MADAALGGAPVDALELVASRSGERLRRMSAEEAAEEFEGVLLAELLKAARRAGEPLGEEDEAAGAESYREFADRFLADEMAASGALGIRELILRDLGASGRSPEAADDGGLKVGRQTADRTSEELP